MASAAGGAVCALLVAMVGCSQVLGIESERHVHAAEAFPDADVGGDGPGTGAPDANVEAGGPWGCLGQPPEMPAPTDKTEVTLLVTDALAMNITAHMVDGGSDLTPVVFTPLAGVATRACPDVLDPTCSSTGSPIELTSDGGTASFTVPTSFSGWFQLSRSDLLPATFYPGQFPVGETHTLVNATMLSLLGSQEVVAALGVPVSFDPNGKVGHIFLTAYDCEDHRAPGVSFTTAQVGPQTVQFYTRGGFPSTTANQTDTLGAGGILNVPTGAVTVKAVLLTSSPPTPLATVNVLVHAGAATFVQVRTRTR
jgi:hypothetical protein